MDKTTVTVTGMTCDHCVNAVRSEISRLPGVHDVAVQLSTGAVTITADRELDQVALKSAVAEAGYDLVR